MGHAITVRLGVIIARERIDHPWQTHRWRPVSVLLDAPPVDGGWRELSRTAKSVHYHATTLSLELHRKETMAYRVNLANGEPSVYVVLREDPGEQPFPIDVHLVTASPFEAQAHGDLGFDQVEAVPMPQPLVALVQAFIDEHHVEETFVKRQRERHVKAEEHQFGQEPLIVLRDRMGGDAPAARTQPRDDLKRGNTGKPE
ncbi:MAG: DUF3305 domain-containing protein [Hyphomicrobiaceae bacterium]|nr:DUF3305 domain-containing protein [Hyphomicrobiaceae bacterium]